MRFLYEKRFAPGRTVHLQTKLQTPDREIRIARGHLQLHSSTSTDTSCRPERRSGRYSRCILTDAAMPESYGRPLLFNKAQREHATLLVPKRSGAETEKQDCGR